MECYKLLKPSSFYNILSGCGFGNTFYKFSDFILQKPENSSQRQKYTQSTSPEVDTILFVDEPLTPDWFSRCLVFIE